MRLVMGQLPKLKSIIFLFCFLLPSSIWALSFSLPPKGNDMVGAVQTVQVQAGDSYSKIAEHYDIGYYELFEANPGVDADNPKAGTILMLPTHYILPEQLRNNTIVINLAEMRLYYESAKSHKAFIFPIGIGKEGWVTPTGKFRIIEKIIAPKWHVPQSIRKYHEEHGDPLPKIVPPGPDNPLGDYALRLSQRDYLIHGTNDPVGIGRRSSAGCIRMYPADIKKLFNLVSDGTRVVIINEPYKIGYSKSKKAAYLEAHMPLHEERQRINEDLLAAVEQVQAAVERFPVKAVNLGHLLTIMQHHLGVPQLVSVV